MHLTGGSAEGQTLAIYRCQSKRERAMTDKQLINSKENCVEESLFGFSKLHPHLSVDFERKIVLDANCCAGDRVVLISGGGSGHEPFPAGYVGEGMLTASVSGSVFTSPPSKHILHGIRWVAAECSGVLLLVPNYTGDVLNFGMAAESAAREGIKVESVTVGDDVAGEIGGAADKAGKRGMCGLVVAFKIAGHLARSGRDLETVRRLTEEAVAATASMGLCVSACCKPGVGPLFSLEESEMEVGVGVHGEAGVARLKMLPAGEAVEMLLSYVLLSLKVKQGDQVVVLVNDLGSLSGMELWLLAGETEKRLTQKMIEVVRLYAGPFFTSLNMAGVQICIMKLNPETKETLLEALDHPTTASAWPNAVTRSVRPRSLPVRPLQKKKLASGRWRTSSEQAAFLKTCFLRISEDLAKQEEHLNFLDSSCGDGDCGTTFRHLAALVKASGDGSDFSDPAKLLFDLSLEILDSVGGTTGALYGLFLKGCGERLEKLDDLNVAFAISECWRAGVETIKKYSSARIGDRTMMDSLESGCLAFERELKKSATFQEAFGRALKAAVEGCQNTKSLKASAGRASYTDRSRQKDVDAGAFAVTVWLSAIQRTSEEWRTRTDSFDHLRGTQT